MILNHIGKSVHPLKACSVHSHDHWELVYNENGSGTMMIDGREYAFCEDSIMLYPPGSVHQKMAKAQFLPLLRLCFTEPVETPKA